MSVIISLMVFIIRVQPVSFRWGFVLVPALWWCLLSKIHNVVARRASNNVLLYGGDSVPCFRFDRGDIQRSIIPIGYNL